MYLGLGKLDNNLPSQKKNTLPESTYSLVIGIFLAMLRCHILASFLQVILRRIATCNLLRQVMRM